MTMLGSHPRACPVPHLAVKLPQRLDVTAAAVPGSSSSSSSPPMHVEQKSVSRRISSTKSNVLVKKSKKREQLESEVQALIAKQQQKDLKRYDTGGSLRNLVTVTSRKHLKELVCDVNFHATVVIFGSPECHSCVAMVPKLTQLAKQNSNILFAKVNALKPELRDIVKGLKVPKVPWFLIFQGQDTMVASFTANLNTIDVLRAEISNVKECLDPRCSF